MQKQTKGQEWSITFWPQGSFLLHIFSWPLQTGQQPELSKWLCYPAGIFILRVMQQKTSKSEMEVTICFFAVSSGYKQLATMTSRLARDKPNGGSLSTCKYVAEEPGNGALWLSSRCDGGCWGLTMFLLQNHLLRSVFLKVDSGPIQNLSNEFYSKNLWKSRENIYI